MPRPRQSPRSPRPRSTCRPPRQGLQAPRRLRQARLLEHLSARLPHNRRRRLRHQLRLRLHSATPRARPSRSTSPASTAVARRYHGGPLPHPAWWPLGLTVNYHAGLRILRPRLPALGSARPRPARDLYSASRPLATRAWPRAPGPRPPRPRPLSRRSARRAGAPGCHCSAPPGHDLPSQSLARGGAAARGGHPARARAGPPRTRGEPHPAPRARTPTIPGRPAPCTTFEDLAPPVGNWRGGGS